MSGFNSTIRPKARKPHLCEECRRTVEVGEQYSRTASVWEGEFFTNVACRHCADARVIVDEADGYYNEWYYGGLAEWLNEYADDYGAWAVELRDHFRAKWRDDAGTLVETPRSPLPLLQLRITQGWAS